MKLNGEILKQLSQYKLDGAEGFLSYYEGERKSRNKGRSQEFSDYRPYDLGDDIRMIDWNAYGRTDQYYVKLYEEERESRITIVLDHSGSMAFSEKQKEYAEMLVAMFAYVGLAAGDSVRLIVQKESGVYSETDFCKGIDKQHHFYQMMEGLEWRGEMDFESLTQKIRFARGITVWISDFLYESVEAAHRYLTLAKQHVIGVQLLTKETLSPDMHGAYEFENIESRDVLSMDVTPAVLRAYHAALCGHLEAVEHTMVASGGRYVLINVDEEDGAQVLAKLLLHRILR
ncbi:MAG: DUF58 domain-containing protein [Clostridia bacterium]|nr:DUF58 domain-containing protein [Clostridia bacterium]